MKYPNIEVQPHWLATLERAAEVMPNCRWVCSALCNDVEPEIEKEVRAAIVKAITPSMTVDTWYYLETDTPLREAREYRKSWLNHMVEQCRSMQPKEIG